MYMDCAVRGSDNPVYILDLACRSKQILLKANDQAVLLWIDVDHIIGIGGRAVDAAPLANGEAVKPIVPAQYFTVQILY